MSHWFAGHSWVTQSDWNKSAVQTSLLLPINLVNHPEAPAILLVSQGEAKSLPSSVLYGKHATSPPQDVVWRRTRESCLDGDGNGAIKGPSFPACLAPPLIWPPVDVEG